MIVTSKRVSLIIICVFIISLASTALVYSTDRLGMKHFPYRNKTLLGIVSTKDRGTVEKVSIAINNVFMPFTAFLLIIICTITLVTELQAKAKWRQKSLQHSQAETASNRNLKVAKMVVTISTLFIVCFTPLNIGFIVMATVPELSLEGRHRNKLVILGSLGVILESVNSSANIFVYYNMSSRYKCVFQQLFRINTKKSSMTGEEVLYRNEKDIKK